MTKKRRLITVMAALCFGPAGAIPPRRAAAGELPSLAGPGLAQGSYSSMHMLLQKTFLKINVATIDVVFDRKSQGQFASLAQGKAYSDALAQQLAPVAIGTDRAVVQMQFVRDVPLGRWIDVVRDNLKQARAAGLVSGDLEKKVGAGLPQWFSALEKRGYEKGDRLLYALAPGSLRTVVIAASGQVLLDREEADPGVRGVVLASYFAPGSDFREPLFRSLVEHAR